MSRHAVVDCLKVPRQNIVTDPSDLYNNREYTISLYNKLIQIISVKIAVIATLCWALDPYTPLYIYIYIRTSIFLAEAEPKPNVLIFMAI